MKLEDITNEQRAVLSAGSAFIGATEVSRNAIGAIEKALKQGIAHSRKSLEQSLPILKERLKRCQLDPQGPVHINSNVRMFDLVRHQRSELHQAELISDKEYFWLCAEAELATSLEGGSPSRDRLEDYDELQAKSVPRTEIEPLLAALNHYNFADYLTTEQQETAFKALASFTSKYPSNP